MKRLIIAALVIAPGFGLAADVEGLWRTEPGDSGAYLHVEIAPCRGGSERICGTVKETFKTKRNLTGQRIIANMTQDGLNTYSGGTIWAPDRDKRYRSKMQLKGDTLKVSGCVAGGLLCRNQTWRRVN